MVNFILIIKIVLLEANFIFRNSISKLSINSWTNPDFISLYRDETLYIYKK